MAKVGELRLTFPIKKLMTDELLSTGGEKKKNPLKHQKEKRLHFYDTIFTESGSVLSGKFL